MNKIRPGKYKHYKGGMYEVLGVAKHSENSEEELVVYQSLDGTQAMWARPREMFLETVKVRGIPVPRFQFLV